MALAFTTGTINQPDAGSVGLAMVEKIRDDVVAHAAWELVEEFTAASGLVRWYVFRCLAAVSGLPNDFFVVIGRTLGNGELRIFICEAYNSSTHVATHFATFQPSSSTNVNYDASGRNPLTYTLSTAVLPTSGANPRHNLWTPSGVSTKYWIIVDDGGFSVAFNGASNGFFHLGAYDWLAATPNPMPILSMGDSLSQGFLTRNPAVAGITTNVWPASHCIGGAGSGGTPQNALGFVGRLDYNDKLNGDFRPVAEQGVVTYENNVGERVIGGWALGKQKRMRVGLQATAPAGIAFGDAYAFEGRLWVPYLPTDWRIWDTGVAA